MVATLRPGNLDERVVARAVTLLAGGGLVAVPTDSSWSVACDSGSREGIQRLKALKPGTVFTPTLVTSNLSQWNEFVALENREFREVKRWVPGPIVFIFLVRPGLRNPFGFKRPQLGLRLPIHPVPLALIEALGRPLFALTASKHWQKEAEEEYAEEALFEEARELDDLQGVGLVLDPGEALPRHLSTVVNWTETDPYLVRAGSVRWEP